MHIYGWPIILKIASLDWKSRGWVMKGPVPKQISGDGFSAGNTMNGDRGLRTLKGMSFAEVVKKSCVVSQSKESEEVGSDCSVDRDSYAFEEKDIKDKTELVIWDNEVNNGSWLKLCAVGVLKKFSDISNLNKELCERQIQSSSFYLGDKNILWVFRSVKDKDVFIKSKLLWDQFFSSVGSWSDAITPQSRLVWVDFRGIPLNVWCEDFFMRLGWAVGEPLMVEDDTIDRSNLSRGRILVLIPFGFRCPSSIKVVSGKCSFAVQVREDHTLVNLDWISSRLGIGKGVWDAGQSGRSVQFNEKGGNSRLDQFNSCCLPRNLVGRKAAQKSLAKQISYRIVSDASKENQLCLVPGKGSGVGCSGLGPTDLSLGVCPETKGDQFKVGGPSTVRDYQNSPVNLYEGRDEANDESEDSSKDNSPADPSIENSESGNVVCLGKSKGGNIVIDLRGGGNPSASPLMANYKTMNGRFEATTAMAFPFS